MRVSRQLAVLGFCVCCAGPLWALSMDEARQEAAKAFPGMEAAAAKDLAEKLVALEEEQSLTYEYKGTTVTFRMVDGRVQSERHMSAKPVAGIQSAGSSPPAPVATPPAPLTPAPTGLGVAAPPTRAATGPHNPTDTVPFDHWAYKAVATLQSLHVIGGYPDGTFRGDRALTRYEAAIVSCNLLNRAPKDALPEHTPRFEGPDGSRDSSETVPFNHCAYPSVSALSQKRGLPLAYPDGTFRGDRPCQRGEFAIWLACLTGVAQSAARETLSVAPEGNDQWSGTLPERSARGDDGPLLTAAKARDLIKARYAAGTLKAPVKLIVTDRIGKRTEEAVFLPPTGNLIGGAATEEWLSFQDACVNGLRAKGIAFCPTQPEQDTRTFMQGTMTRYEMASLLAGTLAAYPAGASVAARPGGGGPLDKTPAALGWGPDDKPYPEKDLTGPDGGKYVWVPVGQYDMGANDGTPQEKPAHHVKLTQGFWIGKCEVSNGQYKAFCQASGNTFPAGSDQADEHPVAFVSQDDAWGYCRRYGLALPTEAQWEFAARGPENRKHPWGNEWDAKRCCNGDNKGPGGRTVPVGSLVAGASWCGALDMVGNVWDLCADYLNYGGAALIDPDQKGGVALRGMAWPHTTPVGLRATDRVPNSPKFRANDVGFRCAFIPSRQVLPPAPASRPPAVAQAYPASSWPMRQRDMHKTGRADYTVPPSRLNKHFFEQVVWQSPSPSVVADNNFSDSQPVFFDGAGPDRRDILVSGYHWPKGVQGMDRHTGRILWQGWPGGGECIGQYTPAFSPTGETVYVVNDATDHPLMAFRSLTGPAANWHNGQDANPRLLSVGSITIAPDGRVFARDWGTVSAGVDLGEAIAVAWRAKDPRRNLKSEPALALDDGRLRVIVGGWQVISCFDGTSGERLWTTTLPGHVWAGATIDPVTGNIYAPVVDNGTMLVAGLTKTGAPLWGQEAVPTAARSTGQVGEVYSIAAGCLSQNGDTYYFQSATKDGNGKLYAIDTHRGAVKWSFATHSKAEAGWEQSSPIVTPNGVIVVGNNKGCEYLALKDFGTAAALFASLKVDPKTGAGASASLAPDGLLYLPMRTTWTVPCDGGKATGQVANLYCCFDLSDKVPDNLKSPPEPVLTAPPAGADATPDVYLSDLKPVSAKQGWGTLQTDHSVEGPPLTIGGRTFARGLGTHAASEIVYDISGQGFARFVAQAGVDEEKNAFAGSCVFQVFVDGKEVFRTGVLKVHEAAACVNVEVTGARELKLVVGDAGDWRCDHADWAEAGFVRATCSPLLNPPTTGARFQVQETRLGAVPRTAGSSPATTGATEPITVQGSILPTRRDAG